MTPGPADPGATLRRTVRSTLAAAVGVAVAFCLPTAVSPPPALAHSEAKAIPLVSDFTIAPGAQGWKAAVTLVDLDSSNPLTRVGVQLRGAGLPRFTPMTETAAAGTYRLTVPRAKARPGEIRLALRIRALPGGSQVTDFDNTYTRTLVRGETLHVVGADPSDPADAGTDAGMFVGGAGALLVVAAICALLAVRSRSPATARGL